jgi:hypothetical protein
MLHQVAPLAPIQALAQQDFWGFFQRKKNKKGGWQSKNPRQAKRMYLRANYYYVLRLVQLTTTAH